MTTPTATIFLPYHALDDVILRGTRAAQPAASAVVPGTLYGVTDEGTVVERSTGVTWEIYSPAAVGGGGAPNAHAPTHLAGGTDALPWVDLPEGIPANPPLDHARLYALDVNGYTQVEMRDGAGKVVRAASDNVLIGKVTEPAGVPRGACLYLAGASGANPLVRLAKADDLLTMPTIGLALDAGAMNGFIRVLLSGTLALLDTSAFLEGDRLFVSPTTAGAMTTTIPLAPNYAQRVGFVTRSHATQGEMLVLTTALAAPPRLHHETHEPGGSDQFTGGLALGITPAQSGTLRLPNASFIAGRNAANTADLPIAQVTAANNILIGEHGGGASLYLDSGNAVNIRNSVDTLTLNSNALFPQPAASVDIGYPVIRFRHGYFAGNVYEVGRTVPMGHWQNVPFSAANFAGGGSMTWTVTAGQILVNRYTLIGPTLIWALIVTGSTLGGTAADTVRLTSPLTMVASYHPNPIGRAANNGTSFSASAQAIGSTVTVYRIPVGNYAVGSLDFEMTLILELA